MNQIETKPASNYLTGVTIVEIGARISVAVCANLLAEAGAEVFFIEPPEGACAKTRKWASRAVYAAGKNSVQADPNNTNDRDQMAALIAAADVVLISGDVDTDDWSDLVAEQATTTIICDFTAFGRDGPMQGKPYDDALVQAMTGLAHTTGFADGPPVTLKVPLLEYSTGAYGASAVIAALMARDQGGAPERIDMALYDSGVNALATFLPAHFGGKAPMRVGNQHSMCAPWNAYEANDGWLLLCSASNPPWQRLCDVMGTPQHASDPKYAELAARMENRDEVNDIVQGWIGQRSVDEVVELLMAANVACGPILKLEDGAKDPNLKHRKMIRTLPDGEQETNLPGALLKAASGGGTVADHIPQTGSGRTRAQDIIRDAVAGKTTERGQGQSDLPLKGIRVLEIGQYTTAPLSTKHLATLGAEVIKIEPPAGDAARDWLPKNDGLSIFFVMSNAGKTSISLDLRTEEGQQIFTNLLESADIFMENLKPGSMARRGFGPERLAEINPRLIYCAISGFGADSVYEERPAFDTVVQAMAGLMSANAAQGVPLKSGVSACDFMGGEVGLFFVLAALRNRKRTGRGECLDLAMQDIAVWMTASLWGKDPEEPDGHLVLECTDGYICVAGSPDELATVKASDHWRDKSRDQVVSELVSQGMMAAPIQSIADMLDHPQTSARALLQMHDGMDGLKWPLLGSPMKFSALQPDIADVIGWPQKVDKEMRLRLGIA